MFLTTKHHYIYQCSNCEPSCFLVMREVFPDEDLEPTKCPYDSSEQDWELIAEPAEENASTTEPETPEEPDSTSSDSINPYDRDWET